MLWILINILFFISKLSIPPIRLCIIICLEWFKNNKTTEKNYIPMVQYIIIFSSMAMYSIYIEKHLKYIFEILCHVFHLFYILWSMSKKGSKIISFLIISILACIPNQMYNIYILSWYNFLGRLCIFRLMFNTVKLRKKTLKDYSRWCWIFFVNEYALFMVIPQLIIEIYYI
jgi:hypothetical protein